MDVGQALAVELVAGVLGAVLGFIAGWILAERRYRGEPDERRRVLLRMLSQELANFPHVLDPSEPSRLWLNQIGRITALDGLMANAQLIPTDLIGPLLSLRSRLDIYEQWIRDANIIQVGRPAGFREELNLTTVREYEKLRRAIDAARPEVDKAAGVNPWGDLGLRD